MRYRHVVPRIAWLLLRGFFWRLWEKYVKRDFHPLEDVLPLSPV